MKKGVFSAILAVALTAAVLTVPIINNAIHKSADHSGERVGKSPISISQKSNDESSETSKPAVVRKSYIVILNEDSLADAVIKSSGKYKTVCDLIKSDDCRRCNDDIKREQAIVKASIQKIISDSDLTHSFTYTAVFNGFSVNIPENRLNDLKKINGVKKVVSGETERIINETASDKFSPLPLSQPVHSMINADAAEKNKFTGSGTLVAFIDNEFDISHSAFSSLPDRPKYTEAELSNIYNSAYFNSFPDYGFKDIYKTNKIVFAYDYADGDNETYNPGTSHGTAVAALTCGNNGKTGADRFKGIAPDAQIAMMKVSDNTSVDSGKIISSCAFFAALDDAVKLGADVISCGFGSPSDASDRELYNSVINLLNSFDTQFIAPSGNDGYVSGDGSLLAAGNIDYGTLNGLSDPEFVFCAASADSSSALRREMTVNGKKIPYSEYNLVGDRDTDDALVYSLIDALKKDTPYLLAELPEEDESAEDVQENTVLQKAVFAHRGEIVALAQSESPDTVINDEAAALAAYANALYKKGAVALIIIDSDSIPDTELHHKAAPQPLPFGYISSSYADYLSENKEGFVRCGSSMQTYYNEGGTVISDYSSYGVTPDMKLKPDITAPGGNVYSAVNGDKYECFSGTSMSAAVLSGSFLALKEYVMSNPVYSDYRESNMNDLIRSLLMSNARVIPYPEGNNITRYTESSPSGAEDSTESTDNTDDSENTENTENNANTEAEESSLYYSPRLQGAGIIDMNKALSSAGFVTVNDTVMSSASLGDGTTGEYSFKAEVHNYSGKEREYTVSTVFQTDSYETENGTIINKLFPLNIDEHLSVEITQNGKSENRIVVPSKGSVSLDIKIRLDDVFAVAMSKSFENGFYIDGYVFFSSEDTRLNIPVMGFYGDTSAQPVFDSTVYDDSDSLSGKKGVLSAFDGQDINSAYTLGYNIFTDRVSADNISIGKDTLRNFEDNSYLQDSFILPDIYLLKNAYNVRINIRSSDGNTDRSFDLGNISSYSSGSVSSLTYTYKKSSALQKFFSSLPDGKYTYTVSASGMNSQGELLPAQTKSYDFVCDNKKPANVSGKTYTENGRIYLKLSARDENALMGFRLYAATYNSDTHKYDYADPIDRLIETGYLSADAYSISSITTDSSGLVSFIYDITSLRSCLSHLSKYAGSYTDMPSSLKIVYRAADYSFNLSDAKTADTIVYGNASFTVKGDSGEPIKGVEIRLESSSRTTDADGKAEFKSLEPNIYTVQLKNLPKGYEQSEKVYLVSITENSLEYKQDIVLKFVGKEGERVVYSSSDSEDSEEQSSQITPESSIQESVEPQSSASEDSDGNSFYALGFIGTLLIIGIISLIITQNQRQAGGACSR